MFEQKWMESVTYTFVQEPYHVFGTSSNMLRIIKLWTLSYAYKHVDSQKAILYLSFFKFFKIASAKSLSNASRNGYDIGFSMAEGFNKENMTLSDLF